MGLVNHLAHMGPVPIILPTLSVSLFTEVEAPQPAPPGLRNSLLPQIGACFVCASAIIQWVMFPTPANKQKTYSMYYEEGIHPISYIGHITFIIPWEFSTVKESLHTLRPTSAG